MELINKIVKIIFLLTQDLESPSGLGRYTPFANELTNLGHEIIIYALHPNFNNKLLKSQQVGNLRVEYVASMHVQKNGNTKTYYGTIPLLLIICRATLALTAAALHKRPDLIWVGKPHPMNGIAGIIASRRWGCHLFLDCDDDEVGSGNFKSNWQRSLMDFFQYFLPRQVDKITTNTHYMLKKMVERGIPQDKIYYLSNGVDASRFEVTNSLRISERS